MYAPAQGQLPADVVDINGAISAQLNQIQTTISQLSSIQVPNSTSAALEDGIKAQMRMLQRMLDDFELAVEEADTYDVLQLRCPAEQSGADHCSLCAGRTSRSNWQPCTRSTRPNLKGGAGQNSSSFLRGPSHLLHVLIPPDLRLQATQSLLQCAGAACPEPAEGAPAQGGLQQQKHLVVGGCSCTVCSQ